MEESQGGLLTPETRPLPIDPGLLERFLDAEHGIEWRPVNLPSTPARARRTSAPRTGAKTRATAHARLACFHDEAARIDQRSVGSADVLTVTSGPVGALVMVGECHRRGLPTTLEARNAGDVPEFPEGAIEARWDTNVRPRRYALPFSDVVQLARYALS